MAKGVEVKGAKEVARTLKKAGVALDDLKEANAKVSRIVAAEARVIVPHDRGRLRGSIRPTRAARKVTVVSGSARVPYAGVIHWGWRKRNIKRQPFLTDAVTRTRRRWIREYEHDVAAELRKVKGA